MSTGLPAYCPAGEGLPDDLQTLLDFATACLVVAAGGREAIDPDGFLLPRLLLKSSLAERIPTDLPDRLALCERCAANASAPVLGELAAAYRSMESMTGEKGLTLFLGVSDQPVVFACWTEAALACRPAHQVTPERLKDVWAGCRAESREAARLRTTGGASGIASLGERRYRVNGSVAVHVTDGEDAVLRCFIGKSAMDAATLKRKSGYPTAPRILASLKTKYGEYFAPAIHCPGKRAGGGYRVNVVKADPPGARIAHEQRTGA